MACNGVSPGDIFLLPDEQSNVKIVCINDRCCNGAPLHPDAYHHPAVVLYCENNSADVLKITSTTPEARYAHKYLKVLGPRKNLKIPNDDDLLLEQGAMDHDSYIEMQHLFNVPISSLNVFRPSGPKLSDRSYQLLKHRLSELKRTHNLGEHRRFSDTPISPISKDGDDSGESFTFVKSKDVKLVRASIDGANIMANEIDWKPKDDTWGRIPKKFKHWTEVKFRMVEENIKKWS